MGRDNEQIIGDYKIEGGAYYAVVRKALGPWPLRNWSWVAFYGGTIDDCREYIRWASRIDAGDRILLAHAGLSAEYALHLPQCRGYDFKQALALPAPAKEQTSEFSGELFAIFVAVIMLLIFGFFYHST